MGHYDKTTVIKEFYSRRNSKRGKSDKTWLKFSFDDCWEGGVYKRVPDLSTIDRSAGPSVK